MIHVLFVHLADTFHRAFCTIVCSPQQQLLSMNIHAISPKHPALQGLVRSFMLMGVHQSNFAPFATSTIPAYDSTGLNIPLFGCHFTIDAASGATNMAHEASIHGQLSRSLDGGLLLNNADNGWFASFNILFSPIGLHRFLHPHLGGIAGNSGHCVCSRAAFIRHRVLA